jgi:hypothetical protein
MKQLIALLVLGFSFTACKKEAGEGGKGEIRGFVSEQAYNVNGNPSGDPYPAVDIRVYIIYGDGQFHDDDTRTGPNGEYRFPWLREGSYRVYAISECDDEACREGIYRTVDIAGRKEIVNAPTITIKNY